MNEITLKDEAVRIDNEIQMWASQIGTAVYNIGKNLTIMKEKELYRELGYESFDEYTEQKYQLKKSQSSKYIAVYNNLDEQYILDNQSAGIQKLYMLSQISEEDREAVGGNLSDVSVTELKAELEKVKQEREGIQMELFGMQEKEKTVEERMEEEINRRVLAKADEIAAEQNIAAKKRIEELTHKLEETEKQYQNERSGHKDVDEKVAKLSVDKEMLETQAEQLKAKIKELESRPQDVAVQEPSQEDIDAKADEIAAQQIEEIKSQAKAEIEITQMKIQELEEKLKAKEEEAENIRAGYEKKLENLTASSEKAGSTQVEAESDEDETAKMKNLITAVVVASNEVLDAANLSSDPEFWVGKLSTVFGSILEKLKGTAL